MAWLITILVIGLVTGWLMGSLTGGRSGDRREGYCRRRREFSRRISIRSFGERLVGEGPLYLASLLVAMASAVALLFSLF